MRIGRKFRALALSVTVMTIASCGSASDEQKAPANLSPTAVAAAQAPSSDQPLLIKFSSTGSADSDGSISKYAWDFGDGASSTEANPEHVYARSGRFTAKLTITDNRDASGGASVDVNIAGNAMSGEVQAVAKALVLDNIVTLDFPAGSFVAPAIVTVFTSSRPDTQEDWEDTTAIYGKVLRASAEIRINTGSVAPTKPISATVRLPADLISRMTAGDEPKAFVQIFQDGGHSVLDSFETVPTTYDAGQAAVKIVLPVEAFTTMRTADGSYEAILIVGSTNTKPVASASVPSTLTANATEAVRPLAIGAIRSIAPAFRPQATAGVATCNGVTLRPPLSSLEVVSGGEFNPPGHQGTDYRAADNTPVMAMAPGKVVRVKYNLKPLPRPNQRTGLKVRGYGWYVVMEHGSPTSTGPNWYTAYGHLKEGAIKVKVGDTVKEGEVIALSDTSGAVTGPHLHVEYVTGAGFDGGVKHDANACMGQNVSGGITVFDNGNVADDAFTVAINGVAVCRTTVGGKNSCAVNGLRSGTANLSITVDIAPDDIGTYQIDLSQGLKFADGTTSKQGSPPKGSVDTFRIVIP